MGGSEQFLSESYERLIWLAHDKGMISDSAKQIMEQRPHETLDELDQCYNDLLHMIKHQAYYKLLERIEKGYAAIEAETNDLKRKKYQDAINLLTAEMESIRPEEHKAIQGESA